MSWSVALIGTPTAICRALDEQGAKFVGQSKQEFDEAAPSIKTLLSMNLGGHALRLTASGHSTFSAGEKIQGYIMVNIETAYGLVV